MQGKALPGFRDFYPDELTLRNHIFATWRSVAARYGFEEYDGPPLEPLELYTQKSGDEIVQQLYAFRDKGDRDVALRPEMTPTLARMADRRVLRALLLGRGVTEAQLGAAFGVIDKSERVPREALEDMLQRAGLEKAETRTVLDIAALRGLDAVTAALAKVKGGEEAGEPLRTATEALTAMGLAEFIQIDLTIVRGLAYYTGIVFELFDTAKKLRAICGGGRYDDLPNALGGPDLPALGFGMGDVVLGELLKERNVAPKASTELGAFLVAVSGGDGATGPRVGAAAPGP